MAVSVCMLHRFEICPKGLLCIIQPGNELIGLRPRLGFCVTQPPEQDLNKNSIGPENGFMEIIANGVKNSPAR